MFWQKLNLIPQVFITRELWYNMGLNYTRSTRNVTLKVDFTASTETLNVFTQDIYFVQPWLLTLTRPSPSKCPPSVGTGTHIGAWGVDTGPSTHSASQGVGLTLINVCKT